MAKYRKTEQRRRPRVVPGNKIKLPGSRSHVNLRRLPWWCDPLVQRLLRGRS